MKIKEFLHQDTGLKGHLDNQMCFTIFIISAYLIYMTDFTSTEYY